MTTFSAPLSLEQCRQSIVCRGLPLPKSIRESIADAGRRLGVHQLSRQELLASLGNAEKHNPQTGRREDADGALALREEMYARDMHAAAY